MKPRSIVVVVVAAAAMCLVALSALADEPLKAQKPITITGGPGAFDWMRIDARSNRVFATHKGTKTVAVVDMATGAALPSPEVGTAQGIAIDRADNKIFLGDADEHKIVIVDYATLKKTGEIPVSGPVDDMLYCAGNKMVYADCDDGTDVWVIDPKTEKIVTTIKIPEAPEKLEYDRGTKRIYQNIKSNNTIQVIDPETNKVEKSIETAPATGPHGLAIDSKRARVYSAGNNGKLVVIDMKDGKVLSSVDIGKGVDQIAFDPGNSRIYCACKMVISVLEATDDGVKSIGNVSTPSGSHTVAVDLMTHAVWTCYFDKTDSYLLKLTP
jgi:YVTN family beta-propeller protein